MKNELETVTHQRVNNLTFLLVDIAYRRPHLHFDVEVSFLLEGRGIIRTQDTEFEINRGGGIIFNSCQTHEFVSIEPMKLLILQFSSTLLDDVYPQLGKMIFESKPFSFTASPEVLRFVLQAAMSYFETSLNSPLRVYGYASLVLDELLKLCNHAVLSGTQQNKLMDLQERISRITSYIHEHYTQKISLDDLAARENFSRTYFSHFFKANFGITFKEYLDNLRCEKARSLLASTNDSLLSICYACGFSDIRTLNNAFSKCYGISPKLFRKQQGQTELSLQASSNQNFDNQDFIDNQKLYDEVESYRYLQRLFKSKFSQNPFDLTD